MDGALTVVLTFWTAFFTFISAMELLFRDQDPVANRLENATRLQKSQELSIVTQTMQENEHITQIKRKLLLAGLKRKSDLSRFLLFQRVCYVMPFLLSIFMYFFFRTSPQNVLLLGISFGVIFIVIPRVWLLHTIFKRRQEIAKYFPDTLDLLVVALEAGLSFDSALVRVGEEQRRVSTQISRELLFTNHQILVGKSREEALRAFAKRCFVEEVDSFVRAVLQANKLGSSLVKTLRIQADALRKKRKQNIQAQILKAPVKLIFPLLFFIFPTLLVIILGPSLVQIFRYLKVTGVPS
ncbi:MAG: type II secretion system F family protein [Candidatus Omnitrophica bacterium]|nr:type II secretion system F family protein [Candidatus Omnitrophota bacterium]